jgi:two-component sensor histidine kinase
VLGLATIRVRLLLALSLALIPVLVLGIAQASIVFSKDVENRRLNLSAAALRSAETAQVRVLAGAAVLETLTGQTVGLECGQRLRAIVNDLPGYQGYQSLTRFDEIGRVACASGETPADPNRRNSAWFQALRAGESQVVTRAPINMSSGPAILAATRSESDGVFDGAMVAVISLESLRPDLMERALPPNAEVALVDAGGAYLTLSDSSAFPVRIEGMADRAQEDGGMYEALDRTGRRRVYAISQLVAGDVFVVMSAPTQTFAELARSNFLSTIAPPLLAFLLAVTAVWVVTDRVVIRWLRYLQRIAAIYAKGRFSVRAAHTERAPPEFTELADTLNSMAAAIVERDESLLESLDEKDRLMREIHHRVKNNLQVISSMVSMQQRSITDPGARGVLQDIRQRIGALALVYRTLYQGSNLQRVDLKGFLEELTAQLIVSESIRGEMVDTDLRADSLSIDPDRLAPLALFAVEAITNAQKHAFHGRGGELKVHFKVSDETARLEISDSGGGDPEAALTRLRKGVGETLMSAFARQLGGAASFTTNPSGGLTAALEFPLAESTGDGTA